MTSIAQSIKKTTEWIKREFKAFDFRFYCERIVSGLIADGFTTVENPEIEGEWLYVFQKNGVAREINIYKTFEKI